MDKQAHNYHLALGNSLSIMRSKHESAKLWYKYGDGDNSTEYVCRKT